MQTHCLSGFNIMLLELAAFIFIGMWPTHKEPLHYSMICWLISCCKCGITVCGGGGRAVCVVWVGPSFTHILEPLPGCIVPGRILHMSTLLCQNCAFVLLITNVP